MPDVYSPVLGTALALLVGALVCLVSARLSRSAHLLALARAGAILCLAALATAVVSHVRLGHTPGSDTALGPLAFVGEHPLVAAVAAAALALLALTRRRLLSS
jgi:hypothetical protein